MYSYKDLIRAVKLYIKFDKCIAATIIQLGLDSTAKIADNADTYAGVSGEARSGQTLYGGSGGLRMAF